MFFSVQTLICCNLPTRLSIGPLFLLSLYYFTYPDSLYKSFYISLYIYIFLYIYLFLSLTAPLYVRLCCTVYYSVDLCKSSAGNILNCLSQYSVKYKCPHYILIKLLFTIKISKHCLLFALLHYFSVI